MPYWSNKEIIQRLIDRFYVVTHPTVPNPMRISDIIQPITNVDILLGDLRSEKQVLNLNTTGFVTGWTVPPNKRYWLLYLYKEATTVATWAGFTPLGDQTVQAFDAATAATIHWMQTAIPLDAGDIIGCQATNNAGDASKDVIAMWLEENLSS